MPRLLTVINILYSRYIEYLNAAKHPLAWASWPESETRHEDEGLCCCFSRMGDATNSAHAVDAALPSYQAVAGISGQLKSVGSDT